MIILSAQVNKSVNGKKDTVYFLKIGNHDIYR